MDRTASLPNIGTAMAGAQLNETERERQRLHHQHQQHHDGTITSVQGRQSAGTPASPASPTTHSAPTLCRPVPARTPTPTQRAVNPRSTAKNHHQPTIPPTRIVGNKTPTQQSVHSTRPVTQATRSITASAAPSHTAHPPAHTIASNPIAPPRTSPRVPTTRSETTSRHATTASARMPAPRTAPPAPRLTLASASTAEARNTQRDPRLQRAALVASNTVPASPASPRMAAYDSPATRYDQSSQSGSTMSLASDGRRADMEDLMSPASPTKSMEMDFEYRFESRAQRRRRSPDETSAEEAKRHCLDSQRQQARDRPGASSPTFAEAVRRSPLPGTSTAQEYTEARTQVVTAPVNDPSTAPTKKKRPRYPPLVVEKLPNWATHFRALASKLGRPPNARPFGQGVRFSPESEDEYRVVQRYLTTLEKEEGVSWFAYSLPADKKLKVAIRGLPADTNPQEIEEELRDL